MHINVAGFLYFFTDTALKLGNKYIMSGNVRGLVAVNLSVVSNQELLVENLEQQLSEVEMIEAMFPNPGTQISLQFFYSPFKQH